MLTHARLIAILQYDPQSGYFTWRVDRGGMRRGDRAGAQSAPGKSGKRYWQVRLDRKLYLAHRLAWFYTTERWPIQVDHINLDSLDNRFCNLRECDQSQNMANITMNRRNTSGYKGIYWAKNEGKWLVQVAFRNKLHYVGYFPTKEEAIAARRVAAARIHGEFARHE